jgi:hypothetical protein
VAPRSGGGWWRRKYVAVQMLLMLHPRRGLLLSAPTVDRKKIGEEGPVKRLYDGDERF